MSKRFIIVLALITALVAAGYFYWRGTQGTGTARSMPPTVVSATEVKQEDWQPSLHSVGSLVAVNGIDVTTEVNGIISDIVFTSGQPVKQGQVLITLDDAVDVAALEALRAERRLTEVQFNRAKDLLQKKAMSKSQYDEAQARYDAARARVKQQETIIRRKAIRAPFDGLAGIRQVNLGEYLEAGNAVVSLQALDPIYVDYTLPERYIAQITTGQTVKLQLDAIAQQVFSGEVTAINSGIDTGTRTIKVRATLANPQGVLRPGMFAEVETITAEARPVLTLPRTAISFNTYGNFIFVINRNDNDQLTVKRTAIETGEVRQGRIEVKGLSQDTQVVRSGLVKLRDGMTIRIDNQVSLEDAEIERE